MVLILVALTAEQCELLQQVLHLFKKLMPQQWPDLHWLSLEQLVLISR